MSCYGNVVMGGLTIKNDDSRIGLIRINAFRHHVRLFHKEKAGWMKKELNAMSPQG